MWDIDFISEDNFRKHVKETIEKYGEKLKPIDLKQFNKNIVDPVKMLFDKNVAAPYHLPVMLLLAVFFSIAGQFGDLVESAIKRHFDVKDSGKFIPGHGGVLDRFDSMLFVFPLMHFFGLF